MNLPEHCIRRPVATTLLWLAVIVAGVAAWFHLPISALPSFNLPKISVSATLDGASPETMAASVANVLEKQFSTIPGLTMMTSSSTLPRPTAAPVTIIDMAQITTRAFQDTRILRSP